jgi:hypothetical protein
MLAIDERGAMAALNELMPADADERSGLLDKIKSVVTAAGKLDSDALHRLQEVERLADATPRHSKTGRARRPVPEATAAE